MECVICYNQYDKDKFKPISIRCGHTHCESCINLLKLQSNPCCSLCRRPITDTCLNYALLDASEERKARSQCSKNYEILESFFLNRDNKLNENSEQLNFCNDKMAKQAENMSNIIASIIQNELKILINENNSSNDDLKVVQSEESEQKKRHLLKKKPEIDNFDKAKLEGLNSELEKAIEEEKNNLQLIDKKNISRKTKMDNFTNACFRLICNHFYTEMRKQQLSELVLNKSDMAQVTEAPSNKKRKITQPNCKIISCTGDEPSIIKVWDSEMSNLIFSKEIFSVVCIKVLNSNQIAVGHKKGFITILNFNNNALKKVNTMNCSYTSAVSCIEALEDNLIASSEEKNSQITVWSSTNYNIISKLNGHKGRVTCIKRFKTNQIISCSIDGSIKIWDYEVGKCLETLEGHNNRVFSIDVCNDLIVSGSDDAIKLWDLNNINNDNKCIYTFTNYTSIISSIIFIDNDYIISGSSDSTLRLWNLNTKKCEKIFKNNDEIKDVKFISSERFVSCSIDGYIKTWSIKSDECISTKKVENSLNICIDTIFDFQN